MQKLCKARSQHLLKSSNFKHLKSIVSIALLPCQGPLQCVWLTSLTLLPLLPVWLLPLVLQTSATHVSARLSDMSATVTRAPDNTKYFIFNYFKLKNKVSFNGCLKSLGG